MPRASVGAKRGDTLQQHHAARGCRCRAAARPAPGSGSDRCRAVRLAPRPPTSSILRTPSSPLSGNDSALQHLTPQLAAVRQCDRFASPTRGPPTGKPRIGGATPGWRPTCLPNPLRPPLHSSPGGEGGPRRSVPSLVACDSYATCPGAGPEQKNAMKSICRLQRGTGRRIAIIHRIIKNSG